MQKISKSAEQLSTDPGLVPRASKGEEGATLAEYALLVVLIAIPVSFVMPGLATAISNIFTLLANAF